MDYQSGCWETYFRDSYVMEDNYGGACIVHISAFRKMERLHKEKGTKAALDYMMGYLEKAFEKAEKRNKKKAVKPATAKDAIFQFAKENRENPTPAEDRFKKFLGKNNIDYKFQVPVCCDVDGYIIDFVIHSKTLNKDIAVEIDGGYHNRPDQLQKDKIREDNLKESGYEVVRFKNEETEKDAIYDAAFKKMRIVGASDVLNKITRKRFMN